MSGISDPKDAHVPALEAEIGHVFRDTNLLRMALTHASAQKPGGDNERLEFLGDRVLGLVVAEMLYKAFPHEDEGHLARRHAALVQKAAIVKAAKTLDIAPHIRLSSGEVRAGGHRKDTILADTLEALIGALYLDGGYDITEKFIEDHWRAMLETHDEPPQDAKTALQEWAQARGLPVPEYKTVSREGPQHAPVFEIEVSVEGQAPVRATAKSKRAAEKLAAKEMLEGLEETP